VLLGSPQPPSPDLQATVRTTSSGAPHILADNYAGVGFGVGHAFAKDNIREIADSPT
jgi:acyl-homoserine-lactone acylase